MRALHGRRPRTLARAQTRPPPSVVSSTRVRGVESMTVRLRILNRIRAGALRLAAQLGSSAAERDDIAVHSYQLMVAAMRGRTSCPDTTSAEVISCIAGPGEGFARYAPRIRAARDAATRLFGLELQRELCRKKSRHDAQLAEEYYASAEAMLPLTTRVTGSTYARHAALFADDQLDTCCNIRRGR